MLQDLDISAISTLMQNVSPRPAWATERALNKQKRTLSKEMLFK